MFPPCLGDVFFKATVLAQQSGASEINIDILLAALEASEVDPASPFLIVDLNRIGGLRFFHQQLGLDAGVYPRCKNPRPVRWDGERRSRYSAEGTSRRQIK